MFKNNSFSKYRAQRTADGFPSKLERAVFQMLEARQSMGEITKIERQRVVVLLKGNSTSSTIRWKVDFSFTRVSTGCVEYCEAKGFPTNDYLLKLKLWRNLKPAPLEIWSGSYKKPFLKERIE